MSETMTAAELDERLVASTERMKQESVELREQNAALHELIADRRRFALRLEHTLAELKTEQERMDTEARRLLSAEEFASVAAGR